MKPRGSPGAPLITVISSIPSAGATSVSYECIVLNALSGPIDCLFMRMPAIGPRSPFEYCHNHDCYMMQHFANIIVSCSMPHVRALTDGKVCGSCRRRLADTSDEETAALVASLLPSRSLVERTKAASSDNDTSDAE